MLTSVDDLLAAVHELFPEGMPRAFALIEVADQVQKAQKTPKEAAAAVKSNVSTINKLAASTDPIAAVLKVGLVETGQADAMVKPRNLVGQLLLGEIAERAFVDIYRETMGTDELRLEDDRSSRNDTDYRVVNGQGRPVFRINIKFHGTAFRNARDLVGLEPEDSFALATYKIHQGLQRHETERLPYVFVIVGVPGLTGAAAANAMPERFAHLVSLVHAAKGIPGKRAMEERIVTYLLDSDRTPSLQAELKHFKDQVRVAPWYAMSARRAAAVMRDKLFERVYAVRVRAFARNYRNAELDMHFSLTHDLTPLADFLKSARERGIHGLAVDLERGVI